MTANWNDTPSPMPKDPNYAMPPRDDGRQGPYFVAEKASHPGRGALNAMR